MSKRKQKALKLFEQGYNCSQSVFCAYCDLLGMRDLEQAAKVSIGLGGGVGKMGQTCGTVTAMAMLAGLKYGQAKADRDLKYDIYHKIQEMAQEFTEVYGTLFCEELLQRAPMYKDVRSEIHADDKPCSNYIDLACDLVEAHLVKDELAALEAAREKAQAQEEETK